MRRTARTAAFEWDAQPETPWLRTYPAGVPPTYDYPAVNASRLLDDAAQDFPETIAVEYRRYRLTYRKLLDHADRFATALVAVGVRPGDRVALLLPNCPQLVIALFAAWRIGSGVSLHTTARDSPSIAHAEARVVVALDRWYAEHVAPVRRALGGALPVIVTSRSDYLPFPDNVLDPLRRVLRGRPRRIPHTERVLSFADLVRRTLPAPDEPADSTGASALVGPPDVDQAQLVTNSFQLRLWLPDVVAGDERVLLAIPLTSALGVLWIATAVLSAATMILVDERRSAARQHVAVAARPTILPVDAATIDDLLRPTRRRSRIPTVRVAIARENLTDEARGQLEELTDKGRVRQAWGVAGVLTHADPVYGRREDGTVGLPLPDTAVAILDPRQPARPLAPGTRGNLWLRGPQLHGDRWVDAATDATLDASGYLIVHQAAGESPPTTL